MKRGRAAAERLPGGCRTAAGRGAPELGAWAFNNYRFRRGDDARWAVRNGPTSPPFPHLRLPDGAPFDAPDFPLVFPR